MKKSMLLIGPFLFTVALAGSVQEIVKPAAPVTKTVRFSVFASGNYTNHLYKHSEAKVELTIWKYNGENAELVWNTTIDKGKLKNYPSPEKAIFKEIKVYGISERKETLVAGYKIIYNSKGSELSYDKGRIIPIGDGESKLAVGI